MKNFISRSLVTLLPSALVLTTFAAHASTVELTNLDQPVSAITDFPYIGQAFTTGSAATTFSSVTLDLGYTPVTAELELEAANPDGTVGSTLTTLTSSTLSSGMLTFDGSYSLATNTTYWLVFSDTGSPVGTTSWDYTDSTAYTAQDGFSIPTLDAAFASLTDNSVTGLGSQYFNLADGPQMFSLSTGPASTAPVPEPGSLALLGTGLLGTVGVIRRRLTA